jgi:hypothetical protein
MDIRFARPLLFVLLLAAAGCGSDDENPTGPGPGAGPVPDFSLKDVNPTSATFDVAVSPRDHLEKVSAWYFGHAT